MSGILNIMRFRQRYRQLTFWNKVNFIGAVASILAPSLSIIFFFFSQPTSKTAQNDAIISHISRQDATSGTDVEVTTASGLKYKDLPRQSPKPGQMVTVNYTGRLTDGKKFDSSVDRGKPFTFRVGIGEVVKGWDEGVMTMKVGDHRQFVMSPQLFYGVRGAGRVIPPDATVIYDVELLSIN